MAARIDIDALLIGALYGELTPADEARLTAHLESHPADRTALDDLKRTRAAVRDSRFLAFQFEPPHAISALLIQEASRRAPRVQAARRDEPSESWFQRVVRSFVAHPAMAAAATLVLVIGVAGSLYFRGVNQYASVEPPSETIAIKADSADRMAGLKQAAPAAPVAAAPQPPSESSAVTGAGSAAGGAGRYAADTETRTEPEAQAPRGAVATRDDVDLGAGKPGSWPDQVKAKVGDKPAADKTPALAKPARSADLAKFRALEVHTPDLAPRDLKDSDDHAIAKAEIASDERRRGERDQRPAGGAPAAAAMPSPPPPPASANLPSTVANADPAPAPAREVANDSKRATASRPAAKGQGASPRNNDGNAQGDLALDGASTSAGAKPAEDKPRERTIAEWARKQHDQVVALVGSNKCREAANAAVEIYNRAPDYYNANIVTDRQIRPCLAYVNNQRERVDRSRNAAKNAADMQAPAQAAPSRK